MKKFQFICDYSEGAHPAILQRLAETNMCQTVGYGEDEFCDSARKAIAKRLGREDLDIHFLVGGTQTNATVISSILKPYQGVVCADCGHINVHETGAIEHLGHKVLALPSVSSKITPEQVDACFADHYGDANHEHMVQPGMLYLSLPTELGMLYSKAELKAFRAVCDKWNAPLYIDGARLGYGLVSPFCDLRIEDLPDIADLFYIGGTKQGALFGEALVIVNPALRKCFRYHIKQNGGMLAKGRLLGIQFGTLFTDDLYFRISESAVNKAFRIRDAFRAAGFEMLSDSPTNQQFPILPDSLLPRFAERFGFEFWQRAGEGLSAVRFCTSWATTDEAVEALVSFIAEIADKK